ncbi:MAG: hypothetical protein IIB22_06385 [Chloroflexi bacterium]|nr:hypothetical protein [Chloroflexota bacterium]
MACERSSCLHWWHSRRWAAFYDWNMTAPDGVIDLPNDILGVILQFQHNCQ